MMKRIMKNASVRNAGWLIFGKAGQMAISLIVGLITARYLGPSNYGLIHYASAYSVFFMAFCTLGINSVLVKEFIDHPQEEGEIIGSALALRAVSSCLSAGVIVGLVCILDAGERTTIVVTALSSLSLIFAIFETFNYWFQARLESRVTAMAMLAAYALTSAYKVILLIGRKGVEWFAFSASLDYIMTAALQLLSYKRHGGRRLSFSLKTSRRLLGRSVHFILPGMMTAVYGYTDKLMLKQMLGETQVGYYATATAICGMWSFVLMAVIDSMHPTIIAAREKDYSLYEKRNRQLYAAVLYLAAFVSAVFFIFGEEMILVLYGEAYLPAAAPLKVATWYTAFSYLGVARNAWMVCEDKQRCLKYIYAGAAACNVVLNALLIPPFGTTGAAAASLATQILIAIVLPFALKDLRRNSVLMMEAAILKGLR